MKALLMFPNRDFDPQQLLSEARKPEDKPKLTAHEQALIQDLELETLIGAMANKDEYLASVARMALLTGMQNDAETVVYRQKVLNDCLKNPAVIKELYDVAVSAIEAPQKRWWGLGTEAPSTLLTNSISMLEYSLDILRKLRVVAETRSSGFTSEGFVTLFAMLRRELTEDYLKAVKSYLTELQFPQGVLLSAELGQWNESNNLLLRKANDKSGNFLGRLMGKGGQGYTIRLAPRDDAGAKILLDMKNEGIRRVATALSQSAEHVINLFRTLRTELGFYIGCLNLHDRLAKKREPLCFPLPTPAGGRQHSAKGLYDVCLSLQMESRAVGNDCDANNKSIVIITGANRGGKSSFLRSVGLAQLMMQAGMFVPAESLKAELCPALFTHFNREEDTTMKSGKFDEEVGRMSGIADQITPNSMMLFNESFAATNEREGSEIAKQIVCALLEKGIKVYFVTHLYQFADGFFNANVQGAKYLRAERKEDGTRTFKLVEGQPLETSFGEDLYLQIFGVKR